MDQILFYTEINKECTDEKLILGNKGIHWFWTDIWSKNKEQKGILNFSKKLNKY